MNTLETLKKLLEHNRRADLLALLRRAKLRIRHVGEPMSPYGPQPECVDVYTPIEDCERLRALSDRDLKFLLGLVQEVHPPGDDDMEVVDIRFRLDTERPTLDGLTDGELVHELEQQRDLMISVATGGPRIDDVNSKYKKARSRISKALQQRGVPDPNPYASLWDWYRKWSSGDLPTYQSRRPYISGLHAPLIERFSAEPAERGAEVFDEPTGWTKVDRGLSEIRARLQSAQNAEQFQAVGLLCREALISLAQTVFDPSRHESIDGIEPSSSDAKRMLEAYLATELSGGANKQLRQHARTSLDLANKLQHDRTADFRKAALCAEATASVVNIVAIVSGQRDP